MEKRGGHRSGAGRKSKVDEQKLCETLSPLKPIALEALKDGLEEGQAWAVKMWFEMMYGKPKQQIEQANTNYDIVWNETRQD